MRWVARLALIAFLVAFPLGIVVDSFYRSSYPEAALAVVEVVIVGAVAVWLRGLRRRRWTAAARPQRSSECAARRTG